MAGGVGLREVWLVAWCGFEGGVAGGVGLRERERGIEWVDGEWGWVN